MPIYEYRCNDCGTRHEHLQKLGEAPLERCPDCGTKVKRRDAGQYYTGPLDLKTVATAWREYGVQPWRAETFKFSTDPELVGKVTDICGLYLNPPENAIVLCVDE